MSLWLKINYKQKRERINDETYSFEYDFNSKKIRWQLSKIWWEPGKKLYLIKCKDL